jgi:hypothetical protein
MHPFDTAGDRAAQILRILQLIGVGEPSTIRAQLEALDEMLLRT